MVINFNKKFIKNLPDAILFDLDNTLYPYHHPHEKAQAALRAKVVSALSIHVETFDQAYAEAREQVKTSLKSSASSHSRLLYCQRMLEILGLGSQPLMALDFEQTYWRTFLTHAVLFEDVKELLDDSRLLGIPTAIVTDLTSQIQLRKLIYFELDHYFDYIVTSEETGADKPDERMFKLALEKIKPVGSRIWMVGDNPVKDILGAKQSINAITFQKIHSGVEVNTREHAADFMFRNFSQIRRILVKLQEKSPIEELV